MRVSCGEAEQKGGQDSSTQQYWAKEAPGRDGKEDWKKAARDGRAAAHISRKVAAVRARTSPHAGLAVF